MGFKRLLETSVGELCYELKDDVEVFITKGLKIRKKAAAVRAGDTIRFPRDRIDKSLEDVLNKLERQPLYNHARSKIYDVYDGDRKVTMLRKILLENLVERGYLDDTEDMRRKIVMYDGKDLSPADYRSAIRGLAEVMKPTGAAPADSTLKKWLMPDGTVLPYHKNKTALLTVTPKLSDFTDASESGRSAAYNFWRSCRQLVMKKLKRGPSDREYHEDERSEKRSSITVIVDDIVSQVIDEFDSESCLAVVTHTGNVKSKEAYQAQATSVKEISLQQLILDQMVIASYLFPFCAQYLGAKGIDDSLWQPIEASLISRHVEALGGKLSFDARHEIDGFVFPDGMMGRVMDDLLENIPDKMMGLPEATTRKLLSVYSKLAVTMPDDFMRYTYLRGNYLPKAEEKLLSVKDDRHYAIEQEVKAMRKELKHLYNRLKENFGLDFDSIGSRRTAWTLIDAADSSVFQEKDPRLIMYRTNKLADSEKKRLFSEDEIGECLQRYGMEHIISRNYWNLVHENTSACTTASYFNSRKDEVSSNLPDAEFLRASDQSYTDMIIRIVNIPGIIEEGSSVMRSGYSIIDKKPSAHIVYAKDDSVIAVLAKDHADVSVIEELVRFPDNVRDNLQEDGRSPSSIRAMLVAKKIDDDAMRFLDDMGIEYKIFSDH